MLGQGAAAWPHACSVAMARARAVVAPGDTGYGERARGTARGEVEVGERSTRPTTERSSENGQHGREL